jgi:hypothetical protein
MEQIFYCVDSVIGSGKTTAIVEYCGYGALAGERFIIAQPTTDLVDQTFRDFRKKWPDLIAVAIHSDRADNVAAELKARTEQCDGGMVIFCTHAGLIQSPFIAKRGQWHLIIDEMPQTLWAGKIVPGRNRDVISKVFDATDCDGKYSRLIARDDGLLDDVAKDHSRHGVYSHGIQDTARKLKSGWWNLSVLTAQWKKVVQGNRSGELLVFGVLDPRLFAGFCTTTFASANVRHTMAHLHMASAGCEFRQHRELAKRLRYAQHPNGHLLTVYYAIEDHWSKKLRGKPVIWDGEDHTVNEFIAAGAMELFGDEPFGKLLNKDMEEDDPFDGGVPLPHAAYGRNDFQYLHNAVVIPALNPTPAFTAYLRDVLRLEPDLVYRAVYLEQVYQASGRISIRNLDDTSPKRIVVADKAAAGFLTEMYPGSKLAKLPFSDQIVYALPGKPGRPITRTPHDKKAQDADRAKRYRWKAKHASREIPLAYKVFLRDAECTSDEAQPGFAISRWDSRAVEFRPYEAYEVEYSKHLKGQKFYTPDELDALLKSEMESRATKQKHETDLIMASFVDLEKDRRHGHTKSNHLASQGVILDFDDTELTPEEVHAALPFRMTVYSSWSHSDTERRYRVCIPTLAMTYDAMEALRRMCVRKLEEVYPGKAINADMSKMSPVALFYLPSVRPHTLFRSFPGDRMDHVEWLTRCPADIIDTAIRLSPTAKEKTQQTPSAPPRKIKRRDNDLVVNRAIKVWQERGLAKGKGRPQFWSLCRTLKDRTTLAEHEIRQIAWEQAGYAHNPPERRGEIDGNLRG